MRKAKNLTKCLILTIIMLMLGAFMTACGDEPQSKTDLELFWEAHSGHPMSTSTTATCTESGEQISRCLQCGKSMSTGKSEALGHAYSWKVVSEPTLFEEGSKHEVCSRNESHIGEVKTIDKIPCGELTFETASKDVTFADDDSTQWFSIKISKPTLTHLILNTKSGNLSASLYTKTDLAAGNQTDPIMITTVSQTMILEADEYFCALYSRDGEASGNVTFSKTMPEIAVDGIEKTTDGHNDGDKVWYSLKLDQETKVFVEAYTLYSGSNSISSGFDVEFYLKDDINTPVQKLKKQGMAVLSAGEYYVKLYCSSYSSKLSLKLTDIETISRELEIGTTLKDVAFNEFGQWIKFTLTEDSKLSFSPTDKFFDVSIYDKDLKNIKFSAHPFNLASGTYYIWTVASRYSAITTDITINHYVS